MGGGLQKEYVVEVCEQVRGTALMRWKWYYGIYQIYEAGMVL
jgi:hypothetical protein